MNETPLRSADDPLFEGEKDGEKAEVVGVGPRSAKATPVLVTSLSLSTLPVSLLILILLAVASIAVVAVVAVAGEVAVAAAFNS